MLNAAVWHKIKCSCWQSVVGMPVHEAISSASRVVLEDTKLHVMHISNHMYKEPS